MFDEDQDPKSVSFRKRLTYERLSSGIDTDGIELQEARDEEHHKRAKSDTFDEILLRVEGEHAQNRPLIPIIKHRRPDLSSIHRTKTFNQRYFSGWRVGVAASAITATTVFLFNTIITLWVWRNPAYPLSDGVGVIQQGSCRNAREVDRWLHLAINVLGTLLLSCSNYCMQCLGSPTRDELVKAHAQRRWLHIGVPSIRNLFRIGKDRSALWILLALSSIPLHLLFNSTIYLDLQSNDYTVITASEDFLTGAEWDTSGLMSVPNGTIHNITAIAAQLRTKFKDESVRSNLSTKDCFEAYSSQYISAFGDVMLIQDKTIWRPPSQWLSNWTNASYHSWTAGSDAYCNESGGFPDGWLPYEHWTNCEDEFPFRSSPDFYPSNGWRCPSRNVGHCDVQNKLEVPDPTQWAPYGSPVKYCLAEKVEEHCRLQFSFTIAIAVIICNLIKAVCMALTLRAQRKPALVTLGDAVASFLEEPDPETEGRCLYSKDLFQAEWRWVRHHDRDAATIDPEQFEPKREYWAKASSKRRWFATYTLYAAAITLAGYAISRSLENQPANIKQLWATGLGTLNGNNLLSMDTSVIGGVVLANVPQAVLSYLYLMFNALYTCMLVAEEWTHYFHSRKPLRVTSPVGQQRSTYWLHLPFTYAIPLTVTSGLLHWLASQSIFMVQISMLSESRDPGSTTRISTCGYSPVAIILTTVVVSLIVITGIVTGMRKYRIGMTLASSCSAAISAACHPPEGDVDASVLPVQWGVVGGKTSALGSVGHCTFTSWDVSMPVRGKLYA
ncbi:hypothetical protein LTR66_005998 [Elasticomyces elasticus]|nr:hypothetical protein LTR66_005998 [Elasticomyces elasticus]